MSTDNFICEPAPTLQEYRALVGADAKCRWDGERLPSAVDTYPHEGGWKVDGMQGRQWLSIQCTRCQFDWSLDKLGVPRP